MAPLLLLLAGLPFILSSEWSPPPLPEDAELVQPVLSHRQHLHDDHLPPRYYLDPDATPPYPESPSPVEVDPDVATTADETEHATDERTDEESRDKRSAPHPRDEPRDGRARVTTGDTILNIRGAVRDAIGDAGGAAPGTRASSRLDTFVIRPAQAQGALRPAHVRTRPAPPQATRSEHELVVEAHSTARIPCELGGAGHVQWWRDGEKVALGAGGAGGDGLWLEGDAVVVGRATRGDAATWRCTRADQHGRLLAGTPTRLVIYEPVRAVYLAVDGRRLDAGNTWVPVRDRSELDVRCVAEGGAPPPQLAWRLGALEHAPHLAVQLTNYSIEGVTLSQAVVTAARELHNATLVCEARQRSPASGAAAVGPGSTTAPHLAAPSAGTAHGPVHLISAKLEIHVTYPPSFVISRWPGFGVSLRAGGAAALRCDVDANPPARAWWLRDDHHPTSSPPPLEEGGGGAPGAATLRWARLRASHAGWYRCRATWLHAEYSSIGYYLNVLPAPEESTDAVTEAEPEPDEPDHQKVEVPLGGNVQLHCPKGSVGCWWRRLVGNSSESWAPAGSHHAHGVLGIKEALYQEGGEYRCVGARPPDSSRLRELKRVTLKVTGGATATALSAAEWRGGWRLECGACGRGVRVVWLRGAAVGRQPAVLQPAVLQPAMGQHCWRAVLHVPEPDEVWCVATTGGGGAVAVFPPRAPPSPAPAPHSARAPRALAPPRAPPLLLPVFALGLALSALH